MDNLLERLAQTVAKANSVEEVVRPFLDLLGSLTGMESTYLTKVDLMVQEQEVLFARNTSELQISEGLSVAWNDTLCKRAMESNQWFTADVPSCWPDSVAARQIGIKSYLSTPVHLPDGSFYGTLCAASKAQSTLGETTQSLLPLFAKLIAQHVEREQFVQRLVQLSQRLAVDSSQDPLTGLPNRRTLSREMERLFELGQRESFYVLVSFIDLDGFKAINDRHGHAVGDGFLRSIANRLTEAMRTTDVIARIGGDEFLIAGVGPHVGTDVQAAIDNFTQRAFQATVGTYNLNDLQIEYAGASIGTIAVAPQEMDPEQAIQKADEVMYEVKRSRKRDQESPRDLDSR